MTETPDLAHMLLPEILVLDDLKRWLRLPAARICRLLERGVLKGRQLDGHWYVTRRELLRALGEQQAVLPGATAQFRPPNSGAPDASGRNDG